MLNLELECFITALTVSRVYSLASSFTKLNALFNPALSLPAGKC
jgi:hypothetical protein